MSLTLQNQIIHGDFYQELPKIRTQSVDMILTDLPYNITENQWETSIDINEMWNLFYHVIKENGVIALTASQPFSSKLVLSNLNGFKHEWVWLKNRGSNFANTIREPMKEHEVILLFSKGKWIYNKQMQERTGMGLDRIKYELNWKSKSTNYREFKERNGNRKSELRVPSSWQKFNIETGLHPTQKPVALFEYLIKTYTNEGDLVLDCCAGSGTTAIACMNTNRNYLCIEKDEKYFEIMKNRINNTKEMKRDVE